MQKALSLNYIESGSKEPTLVFLHYFGGSKLSWQWVISELKEQHCVSISLPGFDENPPLEELSIENYATWILHSLESLKIDHCVLVGHSMSGKLALQAAKQDKKNLIKQLILIAPSPPSHEPHSKKEKTEMLKHDADQAIDSVKSAAHLELSPEKRSLAENTPLLANHKTWEWWITQGMDEDIRPVLKKLKHPVSVLASEKDPIIPVNQLREELQGIADQFYIHPESGHLMPLEDPKWVAEKIFRFV